MLHEAVGDLVIRLCEEWNDTMFDFITQCLMQRGSRVETTIHDDLDAVHLFASYFSLCKVFPKKCIHLYTVLENKIISTILTSQNIFIHDPWLKCIDFDHMEL